MMKDRDPEVKSRDRGFFVFVQYRSGKDDDYCPIQKKSSPQRSQRSQRKTKADAEIGFLSLSVNIRRYSTTVRASKAAF